MSQDAGLPMEIAVALHGCQPFAALKKYAEHRRAAVLKSLTVRQPEDSTNMLRGEIEALDRLDRLEALVSNTLSAQK